MYTIPIYLSESKVHQEGLMLERIGKILKTYLTKRNHDYQISFNAQGNIQRQVKDQNLKY